jgi:arylsulfatase A-like enzyme
MSSRFPLAVCASLALVSCTQTGKKEACPNIIFILADDLGYGDLSCYGQQKFSTPNIDKLAEQGIRFRQFYTGCTVSAPSRSCLMTGQHSGHTPVRGNKEWDPEGQWPLPDEAITVAEILKSKGYMTGAFGKWGLGFIGTSGDPDSQGFDEFFGYNCQRLAHNYYPDHLWHNNEKILLNENDSGRTGLYSADLIHRAAIDFIKKNKEKHFFLFYPTTIPHAELLAKKEYMDRYRGKFDPEKKFKGADNGPGFRLGAYGSQDESHAAFAAMINQLDDYVGDLMREVSELGIEDNTIVFFASDNGPHLEGGADPDYFNSNGGLRGYKRDLYEGGIRTPMIVRWPGKVRAGSVSDHIGAFWDILPTLAGLTGAGIKLTDGISFLPELTGKKQKQHDFLFWEFHEQGGKAAVRMGKWKAVKPGYGNIAGGSTELYDLSKDIGEKENLASSYPDVVKKMEEIMIKAHTPSEIFPYESEKAAGQKP